MGTSKIEHLSKEEIIKNGSIFTPEHIVKISRKWLEKEISLNDYIVDFGVGYGSFISQFLDVSRNCIATDSDEKSISLVNQHFPSVITFIENSLVNVSRNKYSIPSNSKVIIIGNPPYNDITSQYKKGQKGAIEVDRDLISRDLGISFLKMYAMLNPDIICVLHPLSYLIKKTNFNSLGVFRDNYILKKGLIFSSKEFESIKKNNIDFPVVLTYYQKTNSGKFTFQYIQNFRFEILNSKKSFILSNFKTVDTWISKYPTKNKADDDLQFYTIRDINALKRNKTFLVGKCNNGIKVTIDSLYKYAWLDYFKNNFVTKSHFIIGNISPLFHASLDDKEVKKELVSYILKTNDVVRNYYFNNNLLDEVKNFYEIETINEDTPILKKLIHSFDLLI